MSMRDNDNQSMLLARGLFPPRVRKKAISLCQEISAILSIDEQQFAIPLRWNRQLDFLNHPQRPYIQRLFKMTWRRGTPAHYATYLNTSPIARLVYWTMERCLAPSDDNRSGEPSLCLAKEDASEHNAAYKEQSAFSAAEGLEHSDYTRSKHMSAENVVSKIHNWPLGRRIFIAAVISWYT
jgi:hypothetical protein